MNENFDTAVEAEGIQNNLKDVAIGAGIVVAGAVAYRYAVKPAYIWAKKKFQEKKKARQAAAKVVEDDNLLK